jgi:CheY-like chemotaxis protein
VTEQRRSSQPEVVVLCAEDDPDDRVLMRDAAAECGFGPVVFVDDGEQALAYLRREGRFAEARSASRPAVVLLDLNMPRIDGRQVLQAMKADPALRAIPVVVLTTSSAAWDVAHSYEMGASSYITKPVTYEGLVKVAEMLKRYWLETVRLPGAAEA